MRFSTISVLRLQDGFRLLPTFFCVTRGAPLDIAELVEAAYPDAEIRRPAAPVERKPALSTRTGKLIVEPSEAFVPLRPAGILLCQRCHNRPSGDEFLTSGGCLPHLSERYTDFRMHHCQVELPAGIAGVGFGEVFEDR